jgi:septum formation protein
MTKLKYRPFILGSASPRRKAILDLLGYDFAVQESKIEEFLPEDCTPVEIPAILASRKALSVSEKFPDNYILGADTLVFYENRILGKPSNEQEAREMLRLLSGTTHFVVTGLSLVKGGRILEQNTQTTWVSFRPMISEEVDEYIATGEPFDKAGAYGIQERGARFVKEIHGCFYNVSGLPIFTLQNMLSRHLAI